MSTIAIGGPTRSVAFYQSVIGKKVVMAVTGFVLTGFVLGHMVGNLQVFLGPERFNAYAALLQGMGGLLWLVRLVLLASAVLHIVAAVQLALLKQEARPVDYVKKAALVSTYAARTMIWSGPIVGAFLVYHILHFTTGTAHPDFRHGDVYHNFVIGFANPAVSLFYMVANILLAIHLYHGVWSMFQSMGVAHPRYTPWLKLLSQAFGFIIGFGNVSMPLAVLTGIVK